MCRRNEGNDWHLCQFGTSLLITPQKQEANSEKEPSSQMKCESMEVLMKLAKENHMCSFKKGLSLLPDIFFYLPRPDICLWRVFFPCQLQKKKKGTANQSLRYTRVALDFKENSRQKAYNLFCIHENQIIAFHPSPFVNSITSVPFVCMPCLV